MKKTRGNKKTTARDETDYIISNKYLSEKLTQSRKDMGEGKGVKIDFKVIWK